MAWRIELSGQAQKTLAQLDPQTRHRILKFLQERVGNLDNLRSIGEALHGSKLGDFWKYRVGDIRLIADLQDGALCVLVVRVGHRRDIYRR